MRAVTLFTKKWAEAVDTNHGLNLGGIEVIHEMEGTKRGEHGLVWSSSTVKDVHRAVESDLEKQVSFKVIGERFNGNWIDGVELDVKNYLFI
jgi:hypothetical protein